MSHLAWKLNRLSTMAPAEILWRGMKAIQAGLESHGYGLVPAPPQANESRGRIWLDAPPSGFDTALYQHAADRIMAGRFDVFALRGASLGFPPQWNRDPKTGIAAPIRFGKRIDYRNERIVGNIKYLWEINRHHELVTLAQAAYLSGQERYALASRVLLESWFDECPYPSGQAWTSSLENAIRLLNWAVAWQLLHAAHADLFRNESGKQFEQRWLNSIYQHCRFIAGHLSRHSSANNHLFGEYMGLFVGAVNWPCWQNSPAWLDDAKKGLEQEALKQNAPDGVNREQGLWYHHEVADMMLLCALFGEANGIDFSNAYRERLETMLEFIVSMMDAAGNVPMIGDSDDATMVRFSQEDGFHVYRSLLASGAVLFKRDDFKAKAGRFDDKSRWLLGAQGAEAFSSLRREQAKREPKLAFPEGGYYILGHRFDTAAEVKLIADAGPLGYLSIAAHGHADALAFTLSAGGAMLLIDPGTYAYHTGKKWRDYFRGTSAHNTVRVDGIDQSEPGGNFMWLRKANSRCECWERGADEDFFSGCHDGYLRLSDPVMHHRRIVFRKLEQTVLVEDVLECRNAHDIEFFWHFSDTCEVRVDARKVFALCGKTGLEMSMPDSDCDPELAVGQEHPPLGWTSRRFDEKTPSPSIVWKRKIHGTIRCLTQIRIAMDSLNA